MNKLLNIGVGLLIILVVLLMVGQNNLLDVPEELLRDTVDVGMNVGTDIERDFETRDMHGSDYDVLGLINSQKVSNFYDDNNVISSHLFDLY
uniref:Uncharacterized protein n=1 Tax=Megaviridae environmental sample TaxID=1737588 RepID=A0A5J6VMC1_9VIRU|nr:MAG: hypothetical protein [Megaviridae environmental sample]